MSVIDQEMPKAVDNKEPILKTDIVEKKEAPRGPIGTYQIKNDLNMVMNLSINSQYDAYEIQRTYGERGWISEEAPAGGYHRPFAEAEEFDFRLIGARPGKIKNQNGVEEEGLWYRNQFYKKRQPPVNEKKNLGNMIKYSRGAKETDNEEAIEPTEGVGKGYITLITFKGNGPINKAYLRPR